MSASNVDKREFVHELEDVDAGGRDGPFSYFIHHRGTTQLGAAAAGDHGVFGNRQDITYGVPIATAARVVSIAMRIHVGEGSGSAVRVLQSVGIKEVRNAVGR